MGEWEEQVNWQRAKERESSSYMITGLFDQHFQRNSTINSTFFLNFYSLVPKGRKYLF